MTKSNSEPKVICSLNMVCLTRDSSSTEFDLDLPVFTSKVKFGCLYIRMGKLLESHLMGKYCNREKMFEIMVIFM